MRADDEANNRVFIAEIATQFDNVFVATVLMAEDSVKNGSVLTAAPGQPRDLGALYRSYLTEFDDPQHPRVARIGSNLDYAEPVEDAVGPHGAVVYGAKNNIGGSHSIKLTVAGMPRLLEEAMRRFAAS